MSEKTGDWGERMQLPRGDRVLLDELSGMWDANTEYTGTLAALTSDMLGLGQSYRPLRSDRS